MAPECADLLDKPAEIGMEFRGAPGKVDLWLADSPNSSETVLQGLVRDVLLGAVWTGINVAVLAGLIAQLAHVDLDDIDCPRLKRPEAGVSERILKRLDWALRRTVVEDPQLLLCRSQGVLCRSQSLSHGPSEADSRSFVSHLEAMHQGGSAPDRRGDVHGFSHLL